MCGTPIPWGAAPSSPLQERSTHATSSTPETAQRLPDASPTIVDLEVNERSEGGKIPGFTEWTAGNGWQYNAS
ncbi:MAG: hypothetical protein COX57_06870 [Alphaproteobacteria bacterium CG_4_10_14_0_2_um_filter_63_37]|nr:MAG: hypothetical protein AUJ55_06820 [Proteobacteria bacterium CG1_02_64_396]PJA24719.1 MAG: hypothetical protein COX57_06870 [Alphaproteobacteria bacterium CG_4_10_14_0_2_um_filter_63_37]